MLTLRRRRTRERKNVHMGRESKTSPQKNVACSYAKKVINLSSSISESVNRICSVFFDVRLLPSFSLIIVQPFYVELIGKIRVPIEWGRRFEEFSLK